MHRLAEQAHAALPVTIYYAFKQSESEGESGTASTGWETFLEAVMLTLIHLISIPVTNTSVNPARSTGLAIFVGGWALQQLWLFWIAPVIGAAVAGFTYKTFLQGERLEPPVTGRVRA